ncbi:hypothetical protein GCM10023074_67040 [Microbispora amethystogenes]|uniref:Secreted protein n=1 Tax=Microbispora amethystogenes TaxID=1427754 RepID=A0ABQ4FMN7_9ACTN|nr:hypothetical protein Mam01_62440 [Microbispora amethystogenes]
MFVGQVNGSIHSRTVSLWAVTISIRTGAADAGAGAAALMAAMAVRAAAAVDNAFFLIRMSPRDAVSLTATKHHGAHW